MEIKPVIKGRVHIDEKIIHVKKRLCYDLNAIDSKTKYILAHSFTDERTLENCIRFLQQIKTTSYKQILEAYHNEKHKPKEKRNLITFVCDGFENYRNAWKKLFIYTTKLTFGIPIKCRKHGLKHNNNPIERYNQDIKEQIITKRHFVSFERAEHFLNLRRIIKNFINPHQGLKGKTPAEVAEINLYLGRQRLLNLIKQRAEKTHHSLR